MADEFTVNARLRKGAHYPPKDDSVRWRIVEVFQNQRDLARSDLIRKYIRENIREMPTARTPVYAR